MSEDPKVPDYTAMDAPTMLQAVGDDAAKWAAAFCQTARMLGYNIIDEGWMIAWFANAIEYSAAVRMWRSESAKAEDPKTPDFVGTRGHGPDERAHDLVGDILNGRVTRPAREQIKEALGKADRTDAAAPKPMPRGAMR